MSKYNHKKIEKKWQKYWEENNFYQADENSDAPRKYILDMYPYPSADGLHVGHVLSYTGTDIYSRFLRMNGYNVLHPQGWDAFGLPAENYAIKTGVHPRISTNNAIDNFRRQIKSMGFSYDWTREIGTHNPDYYKWTQWFFLTLYNNGLAYKKMSEVNWCDSCKTVLAREQVESGKCERCKNDVSQKELEQWFFKITDFADALIDDLDEIDWPESTKTNQRNWIGRSEGGELEFKIKDTEHSLKVFTTRPDTVYGATYMVIAPEHKLVEELAEKIENKNEVFEYVEKAKKKLDIERMAQEKEKTGVKLQGVSVVNPATEEEIPIFVADYVLLHYGTGAIMAVPAHDERDFEFANKFGIEIIEVVRSENKGDLPYTGEGLLINSGEFNEMESSEAREKITKHLGGKMKTTYKLRDWLVSRQRYWGAPIPIVYDPKGNPHPIPEKHLPWKLPEDVGDKPPEGVAPLGDSKELHERVEKIFGKGWKPEVDTLDTFVCSSWYYFRYTDSENKEEFANSEKIKKWLPIDIYVGGAEHTVLHLMYSRFFTKVLNKLGFIDFNEPFLKMRHQGMILAEDGNKMSKSKGNVINPDEVIEKYGADTLRVFEMFMGPFEDAKPWDNQSIMGVRRFLERVLRLEDRIKNEEIENGEVETLKHKTIKKVTEDIKDFKFNTAVSQLMIYVNSLYEVDEVNVEDYKILLKLLSPFAPHITEEIWSHIASGESIHKTEWPSFDEKLIEEKKITIPIQINGKVRGEIEIEKEASEKEVFENIPKEITEKWIDGKEIVKKIYVTGKILNIVVK